MKVAFYFLVLGGAIMVVNGRLSKNDYCNLKICAKGSHTLCRFSTESVGSACGKVESFGMTPAEIKEVVDIHNKFRAQVAMGQEKRGNPGPQPAARNLEPLKWNPELAMVAQAWANQCETRPRKAHDECRHNEHGHVGQNMAFRGHSDPEQKSITNLVSGWYNEVQDFDRGEVKLFTAKNMLKVGHYTQLVSAATKEIGCGVVRFNHQVTSQGTDAILLICNYGPSGNVRNLPLYETR